MPTRYEDEEALIPHVLSAQWFAARLGIQLHVHYQTDQTNVAASPKFYHHFIDATSKHHWTSTALDEPSRKRRAYAQRIGAGFGDLYCYVKGA